MPPKDPRLDDPEYTEDGLKRLVKRECDAVFRRLLFGEDVISIVLRTMRSKDYHQIVLDQIQESLDVYKKVIAKTHPNS